MQEIEQFLNGFFFLFSFLLFCGLDIENSLRHHLSMKGNKEGTGSFGLDIRNRIPAFEAIKPNPAFPPNGRGATSSGHFSAEEEEEDEA